MMDINNDLLEIKKYSEQLDAINQKLLYSGQKGQIIVEREEKIFEVSAGNNKSLPGWMIQSIARYWAGDNATRQAVSDHLEDLYSGIKRIRENKSPLLLTPEDKKTLASQLIKLKNKMAIFCDKIELLSDAYSDEQTKDKLLKLARTTKDYCASNGEMMKKIMKISPIVALDNTLESLSNKTKNISFEKNLDDLDDIDKALSDTESLFKNINDISLTIGEKKEYAVKLLDLRSSFNTIYNQITNLDKSNPVLKNLEEKIDKYCNSDGEMIKAIRTLSPSAIINHHRLGIWTKTPPPNISTISSETEEVSEEESGELKESSKSEESTLKPAELAELAEFFTRVYSNQS